MTRREAFESLKQAHASSWDRQITWTGCCMVHPEVSKAVHRWKVAWWHAMEEYFPEYMYVETKHTRYRRTQ